MAIKTKEEIIKAITDALADRTDDDALTLIEDVTDTIDGLSDNDGEDWKQKYEENDASWRKRYKDRFMTGGTDADKEDEHPKPRSYADLFK